MTGFVRQILLFTAILMAVSLILYFLLPRFWFSLSLPFLFFFFLSSSILSFHFLLKSLTQRFSKFVNVFLLTTAVKLLLYIAVIIIYVLVNRSDALPFLISFFILYLCYTVFEVIKLVSVTKPPDTQENNP